MGPDADEPSVTYYNYDNYWLESFWRVLVVVVMVMFENDCPTDLEESYVLKQFLSIIIN